MYTIIYKEQNMTMTIPVKGQARHMVMVQMLTNQEEGSVVVLSV